MLHFKDKTKDTYVYIDEMCVGETFKYDEEYFVVMDGEGDNGGICCYNLLNNRIIEFTGNESGIIIEIECIVKEG